MADDGHMSITTSIEPDNALLVLVNTVNACQCHLLVSLFKLRISQVF
jgi:hypothetical protein